MRIFQVPELLSSYVALCALIFALFELHLRIHNETIEKVGKLYSKTLSICQQLKVQVLSVKKLSENIAELSTEEVKGYANSHLRNKALALSIHEIMDLALPCFNLNEKTQEIKSVQTIYNFTSLAASLEASITAFYQGILAGSNYRAPEIENIYNRMNEYLVIIEADDAQKVISGRLTKLRGTKYSRYSLWILICLVLFALIEGLSRIGCY